MRILSLVVVSLLCAGSQIQVSRGTFAAACDGAPDRRSAIQALLDEAPPGSAVVFPAADCHIDGTLTIAKALVLQGQGMAASALVQQSPTATTLSITTTDPVEVRGLAIRHAVPAADGACINIGPGTGVNINSRFVDLALVRCFHAFRTTRAAYWSLTRALVHAPTATGVWVQNDHNHDEGDSQISDSLFFLAPAARGIAWVSGGGLRVTNNKFLGGSVPISVVPGEGVHTTGILLVTGNSLDWYEAAGVHVHTEGTSSFVLTSVTGNEFGGFVGGTTAVSISSANGRNYASTITGNSVNLTCLKACAGRPQYGVLLSGGAQSVVTGNVFGGGSTAATGIHVSRDFHEAVIGENSFSPSFDAPISNASATTRLKTSLPLAWQAIQQRLGAPGAGSEVWCVDCRGAADASYRPGAPCAAPGGGAVARRVGSAWRCW